MLLGIDQGTTGTRACLVDGDGRIRARAYRTHEQHQPQPGWVEHDLDEIWANTRAVIEEVCAIERPHAIAIANQGETIGLWSTPHGQSAGTAVARSSASSPAVGDKSLVAAIGAVGSRAASGPAAAGSSSLASELASGALHHALVWQDTRTAAAITELAADGAFAALVRDQTGLRLDAYFSAPKLAWLLDHVERARELADRGLLHAGTIDTWLIDRLTGGGVFATDASTAARTLLCETRGCTWSAPLLERFGIPPSILAEIRDCDAGFGECTLPGLEGIPIIASLVDQPAALLGQGCIDRGDAKATFGTGCFVYVNTGGERPTGHVTLSTVAWRRAAAIGGAGTVGAAGAVGGAVSLSLGAETTYALDGGVLAVGSALDWLRNLGIELPAAGHLVRHDRGVVCVPALVGLGAPHWDRDARAAWLGMSSATTTDDLAASLVEGIACRVAEVVTAIEHDAGIEIAELRVDGGLTRSPLIMQMHADLLGRPIVVAEEDEATVTGACALAALKLGELTLDDLRARKTRVSACYQPAISADERAARRDRFTRAVAATRGLR